MEPAYKDHVTDAVPEQSVARIWSGVRARTGQRTSGRQRLVTFAVTAAVGLVGVGAGIVLYAALVGPDAPVTLEGGPVPPLLATGHHAFDDGSTIEIASAGTLETVANDRNRWTSVLRGRATFDLAPRRTREVTIEAGLAAITVVGTRFTIDRQPNRVDVSVERGVVVVRSDHLLDRVQRLEAGEQLSVSVAPSGDAGAPKGAVAPAFENPSGPASQSTSVASETAADLVPLPAASQSDLPNVGAEIEARTQNPATHPSDQAVGTSGSQREPSADVGRSRPRAPGRAKPPKAGVRSKRRTRQRRRTKVTAKVETAATGPGSAEGSGHSGAEAAITAAEAIDAALRGADAQRANGDAAGALLTLTRAFGAHPSAAASGVLAFTAGRVATDDLRKHRTAARWFEHAARRGVPDVLLEDLLWRQAETASRIAGKRGNTRPVKRAAARYLDAYPEGRHAEAARALR